MLLHEKIDYLLQLSGMSNIWLAKKMNVDASLISKWRRGAKHPGKKVYIIQLCEEIAPCFHHESMRMELSGTTGIPLESLGSQSRMISALITWLCEDDEGAVPSVSEAKSNAETFYNERLTPRRRGRELALQIIARQVKNTGAMPCLRIYSDEPYPWMRVFADHLDEVAEKNPEMFSRFKRVSLLLSGNNKGEEEFRCGWDIMDRFTDYCEVSVAMTEERSIGVFQHSVIIAGEVGAVTSFGFYSSDRSFCQTHQNPDVVRTLIQEYDAVFSRSQIIVKERPSYTAWEEARSFREMLLRDTDIFYRSYDIPPALIPPEVVQRLAHRAHGGGAVSRGDYDAFQPEIEGFLERNRLYCTFPLLHPQEAEEGMACFPHTDEKIRRSHMLTSSEYLEILKHALSLYQAHDNLVIKLVRPGEIMYDFLAQEMNRYSLSRLLPRKYTYISTHNTAVANAVRQVKDYYADAATDLEGRKELMTRLRESIGTFEM